MKKKIMPVKDEGFDALNNCLKLISQNFLTQYMKARPEIFNEKNNPIIFGYSKTGERVKSKYYQIIKVKKR